LQYAFFTLTCPSIPISTSQLTHLIEDGFYAEKPADASASTEEKKAIQDGPKKAPKVLVKIPQKVIKNCVGIAIYTVMRSGLWVSGAGGSGVLLAKDGNGNWSPPSGILIHTLGVGFMAGVDIYDCVIVINNRKALDAFSKLRVSLGGEVSVVAGPVGSGGILDAELLNDRKPIFSYMKSRGLYAGAQVDGTIIIERNDENARFYGERIPVAQILAGNVRTIPPSTRMLMEVVKDAEGRTGLDQGMLNQVYNQPAPADVQVEHSGEASHEQKMQWGNPQSGEGQYPQGGYPANQQGATTSHDYPEDQKHDGYSQGGQAYFAPPPGTSQQQAGSSHQPGSHIQGENQQYYPPPPGPPPQQSQSNPPPEGYEAPPPFPPRPT